MKRLLCILVAWLVASSASVALCGPTTKPTTETPLKDCASADCHADIKKHAVVHGPADSDTCDSCHTLTDPATHTFKIWRDGAELCTFCHEFDTGKMPVVHRPIQTGQCLGCHNPHGGATSALMQESTLADTCARCHDSRAMNRQFMHTPVKDGDCDACHQPHASKYPSLVDATGSDLCLFCHKDFKQDMAGLKFVHKAQDEGCGECHDVHGSDNPRLVVAPITELCLGCHENIKTELSQPVAHPAATGDRACITCHSAHGSNLASLMADTPRDVCMTCHKEPVKDKRGKILVTAATELTNPDAIAHGPIRNGECGGCHSIHGGEQRNLLRKSNTPAFYQSFAEQNYEMCFTCHDPSLVIKDLEPAGGDSSGGPDTRTKFRNGTTNLHYVHVSKDERGRNCSVCHAAHASPQPQIIRNDVRFGKWKLPITFHKTETGGSCDTGCHRDYAYDRVNPLPTVRPATTRPATSRPTDAPASAEVGLLAQWTAVDTGGREVNVPSADKPTLAIFLRGQQLQGRHVLEMTAASLPDASRAQVVVVQNGPSASEDAKMLAGKLPAGWSVVTDSKYAIARQQGVQVWPAMLLVDQKAAVVAHLTGAPPSLATDLAAYLDLAEGKITRPQLADRLAAATTPAEDPQRKAEWHLQMAARLYRDSKLDESRKMLADGLKFSPDHTRLKVATVEVLIDLKQIPEARKVFSTLDKSAIPVWEHNYLAARIAAAQQITGEAKRLLLLVINENPTLGEAHLLLAQLYERESDWQNAARSYRTATQHPAAQPRWAETER